MGGRGVQAGLVKDMAFSLSRPEVQNLGMWAKLALALGWRAQAKEKIKKGVVDEGRPESKGKVKNSTLKHKSK